jgi:hypothetical protein
MIQLDDDQLTFTFPEIARQLRARVEREIEIILPNFLRLEERNSRLAELKSRWGFRRLDDEAQARHRLRVLTLTADEIETALRTTGLHDASFPALSIAFQRTLRIPDDCRTDPLPAGLGALRSVPWTTFPRRLRPPGSSAAGSFCPWMRAKRSGSAFRRGLRAR